jgi:hypothetical protein
VTICPCCGFKFSGTLSSGCRHCGARSVGEALPKPAHELPSYGRALVLVVTGSLMVLVFATQTIIAIVQRSAGSPGRLLQFWAWVAAGETAAWRLKWIAIPVVFVTLWFGRKLYRSIRNQPERLCGIKYARHGLLASSTVGLLIALLIGITVPARLRQRQMSIDAGFRAQYYTLEVALLQYQKEFKRLPSDPNNLKRELATLPDPNGLIAAALRDFDPAGYQPRAEVAAMAPQKGRGLRGGIIRKISMSADTDDATPTGLSFTDFELRLPGEDKILGTDDDWISRDGVIMRLADVAKGGVGRSISAGVLNP